MDYTPIIVAFSMLVSGLFTVFWVNRANKVTENILDNLGKQLDEGIEDINIKLKPVIDGVSRSMGALSSLSEGTKMEKALERRIGQDMMGEYQDVLEVIQMAFPRVAEYLEERPEAITKLLPRLNTLISDPEARKRLNLTGNTQSRDLSRIWREE